MVARGERRRRRAERSRTVHVQLTDRDRVLLRALVRFRIATTRDLVRLIFTGVRADTAAARLRRLFDAGYVDVRVTTLAAENRYSLGPQGRRAMESEGLCLGAVPRGNVEHHLAIVRLWTELAAAARAARRLRLAVFRPDWELRQLPAAAAAPVIPDALIELREGGQQLRLAIEVDLGTEPLGTLRQKLAAYERATWGQTGVFGWSGFGLVVGVRPRLRLPQVARVLAEVWSGPGIAVAECEVVAHALGAITVPTGSPYGLPLPQGEGDIRNVLETRVDGRRG